VSPVKRSPKSAYAAERRRLLRLHRYEDAARARGLQLIAGMDEVGRGPLAGPVIAACVLADAPLMIRGLDDSKKVPAERREELAVEIRARAAAWAIGAASVAEIERLNIYWASVLAMERALTAIGIRPDYLITDAVRIKSFDGEQEPVIKGDAKCAVVAAASIIAKVHRDALCRELHARFPLYGFDVHKGYATPQHLAAIEAHGPCSEHRRGYKRIALALPFAEEIVAS
jgi:ribonuclease HII